MKAFEITVPRGSKGFGLSLIYRGLDMYPEPETGIFVARVVAGGSSHRAGLRENDKILRINKKTPRDVNDAVGIIKKAGKEMVLTVGRRDQPDVVAQGGEIPVQVQHHQPPLSRSGSARSFNTQFAGHSRPQSPYEDSDDDGVARQQQQQQIFNEEQQQLYAQQLFEQQQQQQLAQQRAAIAEESRRLQQQQMEIRRQKEELLRQRDAAEKARRAQEEMETHKAEAVRVLSSQNLVSDIIANINRGDPAAGRKPPPKATDYSSDDDGTDFFTRSRRSRSLDARKRATPRARSPSTWSTKSGISLHDLSELSTVSKLSRKEEKENLQGLNNRLAGYIDKVRDLQSANARMTRHVQYVEVSQRKEIENIKEVYDRQVQDLKNAIDELAKNYRELQTGADKILKTNRELKTDAAKKSSEVKGRNDAMARMREEINKLRNRMAVAEKERDRVEEKLNEVLPEMDKLQEKIGETLYQLSDIRKVNIDLEAQSKKLVGEVKGAVDVMEERLTEVKVMKQMELTEMTGKLEREYEDRVQKALNELREVYESQMKESKEGFNKKYEKKVRDLQSMLSEQRAKNNSAAQGLEESEGRISALISKVKTLETVNTDLNKKITNLDRRGKEQEALHKKQFAQKEEEVNKILAALQKQMEDYQTLLETKTALDMEIAVYRKLVESEEDRLGIDNTDNNSMSLPSSRASTPATPASPGTRYKTIQQDLYSLSKKSSEDYAARRLAVSQTQL